MIVSITKLGAIELAKEEALEEGLKQGIEQGIIETAKKMLALGAETSFIKKVTSLNDKEIKDLAQSNKI